MIAIENYYVAINNSTDVTDCGICEAKANCSELCTLLVGCPLRLGYYFKKR